MSALYPQLPAQPPRSYANAASGLIAVLLGTIVLLYVPLLLLFSVLAQAYVLTHLWGWFIVPTFHLPALSLPMAVGVRLVAGFMTPLGMPSSRRDKDDKAPSDKDRSTDTDTAASDRRASRKVALALAGVQALVIVSPFLWLGVGWIVHRYFLHP